MQTSYTESIMGQARVKMPIVLDRFYFLQKLSRGGVRQLRYWIARSPKRCILGSFPKAVLRPLNLTGAKMTLSIKTKSFESRLGRPLIIHQITKWNLCYVVRNIRFTSSGIVITHLQSSIAQDRPPLAGVARDIITLAENLSRTRLDPQPIVECLKEFYDPLFSVPPPLNQSLDREWAARGLFADFFSLAIAQGPTDHGRDDFEREGGLFLGRHGLQSIKYPGPDAS
jgi:hypothetical protein